MYARRAKTEEYAQIDRLFSIAFMEPMETGIVQPVGEDDIRYAAFDENGVMTSAVYVPAYEMNFDGSLFKMAGIGGVSTLPVYRRQGGISACFKVLLPEIYAAGFDFSYLYPFSFDYYGKFGYGKGCLSACYSVATAAFPKDGNFSECFMLEESTKERALETMMTVAESWQKRFNGMSVPMGAEEPCIGGHPVSELLNGNPYTDKKYTYLYDNDCGSAALVTFSPVRKEQGLTLCCSRLMYTDAAALKVIFSLLATYRSDYVRTEFSLPVTERIEGLISEWSFGNISRYETARGMVRVVNVRNVLKKAHYRGTQELVLEITDPFIEANNVRVKMNPGDGVSGSFCETDVRPDVTLSINDFSQLILGTSDTEDIAFMPGVSLNCPIEKLAGLFYKKPCNIDADF